MPRSSNDVVSEQDFTGHPPAAYMPSCGLQVLQLAPYSFMWRILGLAVLLMVCVSGVSAERWVNPPKRAPHVEHRTFRSSALNRDVGYNICLPSAYGQNPARRWPVVYYLHGYQGHESSYLEYAQHGREAERRFGPVILVFMNGGGTSFFTDSPDGSIPGETVVVRELVPHIDSTFRTIATANGRSLHGYSMGGFGALKLLMKHPDTFSSAVAYGATLSDAVEFRKHLGKVYARMFGGDAQRFANNDPLILAERDAAQLREKIAISIIIGSRDEFLPRNRALRDVLQRSGIPVEFHEIRGARHNKDDLYETAALRGFEFSFRHFTRAPRSSK